MKKLFALLLAVLMVVSLAACGTPSSSQEETSSSQSESESQSEPEDPKAAWKGQTLDIAIGITETLKENEEWYIVDIYNAAMAWAEETGVIYNYRSGVGTEQLMAAQAAGKGIDVIRNTAFPSLPAAGVVLAVEDYLEGYEDVFDQTELDSWKGHVWRLTYSYCNYISGMMVNENIFENLGLTSPKDLYLANNWTWETFRDAALKTTQDVDGDGVTDIWGCSYSNLATMIVPGLIGWNEDGSAYSLLDSDYNRRAFEFLYQLCSIDKVVPPADVSVSISNSNVAMEPNYSLYGKIAGNGDHLVPVPMPKEKKEDKWNSHYMNDYAYYVGAACTKPEMAIDLIAALQVNAHKLYRDKRLGLKNKEEAVDLQYILDLDKALMAVTVNDWFSISGVTNYMPSKHDANYGQVFTVPTATALATLTEKHKAECDTYNKKYIYFN